MHFSSRAQHHTVDIIHGVQVALAIAVLVIGLYRLFNKSIPGTRSRSSTWVIGVSAKSLIIITYEVLSEKTRLFHRFYSIKAFMILNIIEFVFWIAAGVMGVMGLMQVTCQGIACPLSGVSIGLSFFLAVLAIPVCIITTRFFVFYRKHGYVPGSEGGDQDTVVKERSVYDMK